MSKARNGFTCQSCHYQTSKWIGKCPSCNNWNSFSQLDLEENFKGRDEIVILPKRITKICTNAHTRLKTGYLEFDNAIGGGVAIGSISILGGDPGVGKSTLMLQVSENISKSYAEKKVLYISSEENLDHLAVRYKRLNLTDTNLYVVYEKNWNNILKILKNFKPDFIVIDSIHAIESEDHDTGFGAESKLKLITNELINFVRNMQATCFVVGHVTKDSILAGPKILEHMVDTVLYLEGERHGAAKTLRVQKNRFGSTKEIGLFNLNGTGFVEVDCNSNYFVNHGENLEYGRSLTCSQEGNRMLFIELQALVIQSNNGNVKRISQGYENTRLYLMAAIIEKYLEIPILSSDLYINIVGGFKLSNNESDLGIVASLLSSYFKKPIPVGTVFLGEVGLSGDVRIFSDITYRIKEMEKFKYSTIVSSNHAFSGAKKSEMISITHINNICELKNLFF